MKTPLSRIASIVISLTAVAIPVAAVAQQVPAPNSPADAVPGTPPNHKHHKKHHKGGPDGLGPSGYGPEKGPDGGPSGATPANPTPAK